MPTRSGIPKDVVAKVLITCRRRCALCSGLDGDLSLKKGQIAHIDRDNQNSEYDNLAFLCLSHHEEYDTRSRQAKGLTPDELRIYRDELHDLMRNGPAGLPEKFESDNQPLELPEPNRIDLSLFDRRLAVYRAIRDLLGAVGRNATIDSKELATFRAETDEALFLFDAIVADYIAELYRHAVLLQSSEKIATAERVLANRRNDAWEQNERELLWFLDQYSAARRLLYPYLRLTITHRDLVAPT